MTPARWLLPALLTLSLAAHAQTAPNCALANLVDDGGYATLTIGQWSEADQDNASFNWAECRAARLRKELTAFPKLSARIDGLRQQYREMRALEGQLAGIRAGGGTLYSHAVPRMYPELEGQLQGLSALARSSLGARTGQLYGQKIAQATADHLTFVATLRAYKPAPDEQSSLYKPQEWKALVDRYEALGRAVMTTLGSRNDAATALGYSILNSTTFGADDLY
ncbi:hypothetical protein [Deinococcus humi]|uniref:Uncharacterized protein n=1 Tax=Deinococcus humi TaxID=662880 RepID=A0A7W8JPV6_9DEIO|nr:hypothetical protein [Deinococcus humi]MBB5361010.1 hypothetical protein [Deinococcus humi]GGO18049.1 hypothetical protein GCM10008949_00790 [Deinococcus humi]